MFPRAEEPDATFWQSLKSGRTVPMRARGFSMRPWYPSGSLFLLKSVTAGEVRTGDLVLQEHQGAVRLHRLLGWDQNRAPITKGDWLDQADPIWPATTVRGRAVAVVRHETIVSLETPVAQHRARLAARLSPPTGRFLGLARTLRQLVRGARKAKR